MIGLEDTFQGLRAELLATFRRGVEEPLPDQRFNELALRVFCFQSRAVPAYGAFVARRGIAADRMERWEEIPFLPTRAFKSRPLVAGELGRVQRVFRTSGTTGGREGRGEHHVLDLALYREALLPPFRANLLPEGAPMPVLCLLPSPAQSPDSSLSFMMGEVLRELGGGRGGFFVDPGGGIQAEAFRRALEDAVEAGVPVLVAGTAFAFVHWVEVATAEGWRVHLPLGSRVMETGGYKGRSRSLPREELYRGLEGALGVPLSSMVNEYGMTELLSQFYEPVLGKSRSGAPSAPRGEPARAGGPGAGTGAAGFQEADLGARYHRGPPWVRTLVLDPLTLEPAAPGAVGILAHVDLANLGSVSALLTEDLGRAVPGGFRLLGRSHGAEPRGCSLAMESFLEGGGSHR